MSLFRSVFVAAIVLLSTNLSAHAANLVAHVDISSQTMTIKRYGIVTNVWRVSTGRKGYATITGKFRPQRMARMWYSRKYDNAPMPYSVFFRGGFAVHGTNYVKRLGSPASHGCVRLHTSHAAQFYSMVQHYGRQNVRIIVTQ
ncbi:MAG: L,D-transpeptidase [Rhizobiaceae bacterium]